MVRTLQFLGALLATNMKASLALRGAFWARAIFMFLNNLIFLIMWWVFFDYFEQVRGWRMADMLAIYAVAAGTYGLAVVLGAGVNDLARLISQGDLDTFLTQPKHPLLTSVASRSEAAGWGDMASGALLYGLSGYVAPQTIPICLFVTLCGCLVYLATCVMLHSLSFWLGDTHQVSRQASQFILIFSIYPKTIFSGWLKLVLFTAIPAGFITFLPVDLVRHFSWPVMAAVAAGALGYTCVAAIVFRAGLRRYESGNRFGVRV
jgi:ABC-2 type transport system permease protein